jgi:hypothetical protein
MHRWLIALVLALPLGVFAEKVEKGQPFPVYTLEDPHGVTNTLKADTRFVIIASEMPISKSITAWLKTKAPDYLEQHRAEYVSDVTPMPGIISFLFAKPKMRKYPFRMLLAEDPSFAQTYPRQDGKLALFVLDENRVVADLHFLAKPEELEPLLGAKP